jgi:hypothetical protein
MAARTMAMTMTDGSRMQSVRGDLGAPGRVLRRRAAEGIILCRGAAHGMPGIHATQEGH